MVKSKTTVRGSTGLKKLIVVGRDVEVDYKDRYFNWTIDTNFMYSSSTCFDGFVSKHSLLRTVEEFEKIITKLNEFRRWTWRQIETSFNGTSCGAMSVGQLDKSKFVSEHLKHIKKDSVDQVYKMEINNHHRVWGIREGSCLYLIWNDPDHSFYKHKNKNYTLKKCG